jgi:hypothetical protein
MPVAQAITKERSYTMATKKEVTTGTPDWADMLAGSAGAGLESVRPEDLAMPMFRLLQSLSPETKKSDSAYVQGASEGQWYDTVGRAVYDSIVFIPSRYATHYIEWRPRKDGGGLVANHGPDRSALDRCTRDPETGRDITPDGNEIVATATWYGIVVSGTIEGREVPLNKQAIITLSGTQQKVSRKWVSDAASIKLTAKDGRMFTPPLFSMAYKLGSTPTKNDQGSWSLASFERAGWVLDFDGGKELFDTAKAFSEVARDMQPQAQLSDDSSNVRALPSSSQFSEEIPF